jgi:2,3,4,5-tetrahydropyridine-2-carboxylate N-succinyltransferase
MGGHEVDYGPALDHLCASRRAKAAGGRYNKAKNPQRRTKDMAYEDLESAVDGAWEDRESIGPETTGEARDSVEATLDLLDTGKLRVAEKIGDEWRVHQWAKKAVLLSFRLYDMAPIPGGPTDPVRGESPWFDKIPSKFAGWGDSEFRAAGFRAVPSCVVRRSAYIAPGAVLMPSFVNLGAHVGSGTMVDTWATVGSCAQIGANCHLSGGIGIGGVLEPLQAGPVIIEDNCFIGARSEVAEGVIVGEGAVLSMGVFLGASTKIVNRDTGEVIVGQVPPYSVVVPGTLPGRPLADGTPGPALYCAVIVKQVDAQTRSKTSINDLLRD